MIVGKIDFTSVDKNTRLQHKQQARNIAFTGTESLLNRTSQLNDKGIAENHLLHKLVKGTKNLLNIIKHALIGSEITEFALVKDEVVKNGNKVIKNKDGKIVKAFYNKMGEIGPLRIDYNLETGKRAKITFFNEDGKAVVSILDYDLNKRTRFHKDGKTIDYIVDYDSKTENKVRETFFNKDGKTVASIIEYFPETGLYDTCTMFYQDGKTILAIASLDPITGKVIHTQRSY